MKKIISMAIVMMLALSLIQISAFAAAVEGTDFENIETNEIRILTQEGWTEKIETGKFLETAGNTVYLKCNVTLGKTLTRIRGNLIGEITSSSEYPKIKLSNTATTVTTDILGSAKVQNLILEADGTLNISTSSSNGMGILVHRIYYEAPTTDAGKAIISNITNNANVNTSDSTATGVYVGLIGFLRRGNVEIKDCINNGSIVDTKRDVGGIIGGVYSNSANGDQGKVTIENCKNKKPLQGTTAGGIIGNVLDFYSLIEIIGCLNSGNITGGTGATNYAGGIVGAGGHLNKKSIKISISKSANIASASAFYAGGITGKFGMSTLSDISITESYNEGDVTAMRTAGGICGSAMKTTNDLAQGKFKIADCYNKGKITSTDNDFRHSAGFISNIEGLPEDSAEKAITSSYNAGTIISSNNTTAYNILATANGDAVTLSNLYGIKAHAGNYKKYATGISGVITNASNSLPEASEAGYERLPDGFNPNTWVSLEGSYPVLRNNLPVNADLSEKTYYTVTLTNGANSTALKDAETLVEANGVYTLTVKPASGYEVDEVIGLIESSKNSYKTANVTGDLSVSVTYKQIQAEEGITTPTEPFSTTIENMFYLTHFAKYNPIIGKNAVFGILLSTEEMSTELFKIGAEQHNAVATEGANENGEYGIEFSGAFIKSDGTYYLRPYVIYDGGEPIYSDNIAVYNE